jgi:predicted nucleic acid-binding protein
MFVVDASMTLAWCFDDEANGLADAILPRLTAEGGVAPAHWPLEVANGLRSAAASGRIDERSLRRAHEIVATLPIDLRPVDTPTALRLTELALRLGLTVYDAAYLDLAGVLGVGLATLDERLAAACRTVGVPLVD